jgi:hypothetical protein
LLLVLHQSHWAHPETCTLKNTSHLGGDKQLTRQIDIVVLKKLAEVVNVVPVIAKSDALTLEERHLFKQRVSQVALLLRETVS